MATKSTRIILCGRNISTDLLERKWSMGEVSHAAKIIAEV